jgi:hypothetical protein
MCSGRPDTSTSSLHPPVFMDFLTVCEWGWVGTMRGHWWEGIVGDETNGGLGTRVM